MKTVGTLRDVNLLHEALPGISLRDCETVHKSRAFRRWYKRNQRVVNTLAVAVPSFVMKAFGISPTFLFDWFMSPVAIPTVAGGASFGDSYGVILLHMMIIGFLTLVVTTFLKFTGRGDLVPLIAFVGGGAILYEVIGMFKDIYQSVAGFINM